MNIQLLFVLICYTSIHVSDGSVEWLSSLTHDFGDIPLGKPVTVDFKFRNSSNEPFSIDNVRVTCGCTATDWEDDVILPGEESKIHIEFDAKKIGYFRKKITVFFSGDKHAHKLFIEGYVE